MLKFAIGFNVLGFVAIVWLASLNPVCWVFAPVPLICILVVAAA